MAESEGKSTTKGRARSALLAPSQRIVHGMVAEHNRENGSMQLSRSTAAGVPAGDMTRRITRQSDPSPGGAERITQPTARQKTGADAEERALAYLSEAGLRLVERNFLCKVGEIDLIMRDGAVLVFVEVRSRADDRHGGAAASITPAKQRRLVRAAQFYLQRWRSPPACRFDAVAIDAGHLSWLKNVIVG